ncbi:unnamed protein product [Didymodactylos carnosus]|uniref:Uricase n=1 Tax=Didymodactylos carnosus TaxID=1234261 RepID=A0A815ITC2_9BILA|nr:unnamed protein product [Didymodactylos carnosus]CAF1573506.1 unnamed protein product [Didymodactylos carnosus]CAF4251199.1 unnamed protein product [Didymodactylos carnosus]CAF4368879.1 unnamed protein product [Didymodactylos carnosus]
MNFEPIKVTVGENRYGKEGIRLIKVNRSSEQHKFSEWTVRVLLEGDFDSSYEEGDNSKILPTDTMKNTVYSLARRLQTESMEDFGKELVNFLHERNPQVSTIEVKISGKAWEPIRVNQTTYPTAFVQTSNEIQLTTVKRAKTGPFSIVSGLDNLLVIKTAKSSFTGYMKDSLTTLPEADDRLFGTSIRALWTYDQNDGRVLYERLRQKIRNTILEVFSKHESKSVQRKSSLLYEQNKNKNYTPLLFIDTLHAIGKTILEDISNNVIQIHTTMPNIHCLLFDLSRFGQDNPNEIFYPIDDPHGLIQCCLKRQSNTSSSRQSSKVLQSKL